MDPNEELKPETKLPEGILRFAGRKAGGGLAAIGNVFDLPGSTARDLLTWVPGGMEAQNPLDQWIDPLGYNTDENRVYGREVLRANNMADQADTNGNFWGGLAYDVVTDPLLYLTGGLTKAGEAISKTGARALARPAANLKAAKMAKEATGNGAARLLRPIRGIGARAKVTPQDIFDSITDEAARAQAYDEFLQAGGTDAMLNEPLSAIKLKFPMSGYINQVQKKFTGKDLPEAFVRGVEILKTNPSRAMERFVNNNLDRAKAGSAVDDTVPPPDGAGPIDPMNPGDGPGPVGPVDPINPAPVNPVDAGDIEDLVNTYGLTPEEAAGVVERNKNWIDQNRGQVGPAVDEAAQVNPSTGSVDATNQAATIADNPLENLADADKAATVAGKNLRNYEIGDNAVGSVSTRLVEGRAEAARIAKLNKKQVVSELRNHGGKVSADKPVEELRDDLLIKSLGPNKYRAVMEEHNASVLKPTEASPPPAFSAKSLVKDMNDGSTLYRSYHKTFAETGIATDGHFAVVVPESLRPDVLKSIGKIDAEVNSLPESALKNVLAEGTESASIIGQSKAHVSSMFDRAGDLYIVHGLSGNLQLVNKSYADNILSMYPSASVSLDGSRVVFSDGGRVVGAVMSVDYSKLSKNTQNIISNYPNVIKSTASVAGKLTNLDDVAAAVKAAGEPYGIIDPAQLKKLIKVVKEKNPDGSVSYRVDDSDLVKAYGPASDIDPDVANARRASQQAALDADKAREASISVGSTEAVANAAQKQIDKPKSKRGGLRKKLDARLEAIAADPALDKGDELDRLLAEQSGLPPTNNPQVVNAGGDLVQRPDVVIPNTAQSPVPPVEPPMAGGSGGGVPSIEPPAPPMAGAEPPMGPVDPINPGAAEPPPLPPSQPPRVGPNNNPETLGNRIYDYMTDAADRFGDFAYMVPGVAALRASFTPEIKGALTEEGRAIGRMVSLQEEQMIQGARAKLFGMVKNLDDSRLLDEGYLVKSGMSKTEAIDLINSRGGEILNYLEGRSTFIPKWMEPIVESLNSMRREYDDMLVKENEDGIRLTDVNDLYSEYVRRLMRSPSKEKVEIKGSTDPNRGPAINTRHKSQMARAEEYRDLPGGTSVINEMSIDGNISGIMHISPMIKKGLETADMIAPRIDTPAGKVSLREYVFANYGDQLLDGEALKNYNPAKSTDLDALIRKVANYDRGYVDTQMPIFGRDPMYDLWVRMQDSLRTRLVGRAAMDMLGKAAVAEKYADFPKDQLVRMDKMLDDLKIWNPNAVRHMIASASPEIQKTLATNIDNEASMAMAKLAKGKTIRYRVGDDEFVITPEMDGKAFTGNATVLHKKGTFASEPYTKEIQVDGVDPVTRNPASVLVEKIGKRVPQELIEIEVTPEFIRGTVTDKATIETAKLVGVHKSLWDESNRFMKPFSDPEAVGNILGAARAFTNLFKTGATAAFPAFHARNLVSGQINNALHGAYDPRFTGYKRFYQPVKDAIDLNQGKPFEGITDLYKGLTPEKAMEELQKEIFSTGLLAEKQGIAAETLGDSIDKLANQIPGQNQLPNPLQAAKKAATTRPDGTGLVDAMNPLGAKGGWTVGKDGIKQLNDDTFLLYRWGRDTAAYTEYMNRVSPYIAFRRQGYSAMEAKRMVDRIQVDYSNLTPFERKYMRLVMPFYTYSKGVLPTVLEDLVKRPGGPTATLIKTANHLRDPNASVPEHISSTMAIPWGQGEDGTQSYITGFGLPFEDTLNLINGPLRLDPSESLREVIGRSNPLVKATYEQASGRSAFWDGPDVGGRPLTELDPPIGRTVANISDMITGEQTKRADPIFGSQGLEYIAAASPFGRFTTTARQLTDQRKLSDPINLALNILSGVRVNDVSPEAQDSLLRDRIGVILKEAGARKFSRDYLPDYAAEKLSDEQKKEVELLLEALKSIDKRFKERREAKNASSN